MSGFTLRRAQVDFNLDVYSFGIHPVPAEEEVFVTLGEYMGEAAALKIYNSYGQPIFQQDVDVLTEEAVRIDLAGWASGVYHLTVQMEGRRLMGKRFVVVKP